MPRPLILSLLLHGALILVAIFGLPRLSAPPDPIAALEVSLVSAADLAGQEASPPAVSEPEPEPEPVPDPVPVPPARPPEPTPEVAPEPAAPLPSEVPDLVDSTPPPVDRVAPTPSPESDLPDGPTLVTPRAEAEAQPESEPEETPEPQAPEEASPQTITEAVETEERPNLRVATSPIPAPRPARPRPVVPEPEPEPVPEPVPEPQPEPVEVAEPTPNPDPTPDPEPFDPIAAAVANALAGVSDPTPSPAPAGPPLSAGEETALRRAVSRCWNFAGMSTEAMRVTITIALDMTPQATIVQGSMALKSFEGGSSAAADAAYRAARSALFRCQGSGYPLPAEKYESWKQIEMTFNPERMRLR